MLSNKFSLYQAVHYKGNRFVLILVSNLLKTLKTSGQFAKNLVKWPNGQSSHTIKHFEFYSLRLHAVVILADGYIVSYLL